MIGCCGCTNRTCPTCGGLGVIPNAQPDYFWPYGYPYVRPWRIPRPCPRPILVVEQGVPGFDRSHGALRDRVVALG